MAYCPPRRVLHRRLLLLSTGVALAVLATGCASSDNPRQARPAPHGKSDSGPARQSATALQAATAHWATAHLKDPKNPEAALNYALNLKALNANDKAIEVLAAAHRYHPEDPRIASEYGRLALQADQLELAERLLTVAERNSRKPDWHVLAARGTLLAKRGKTEDAQRYYMAALQLEPDSLSTLNNLALSYALDGKPEKAETLLRRVVAKGGEDERVRQNLALVLGLQGKYSEGLQVAQAALPDAQANANMAFLRNMVGRQQTSVAEAPKQETPAQPAQVAAVNQPNRSAAAARKLQAKATAAEQRRPLEEWASGHPAAAEEPATSIPNPAAAPAITVAAAPRLEPLRTPSAPRVRPSQPDAANSGWSTTVSAEPTRLAPGR